MTPWKRKEERKTEEQDEKKKKGKTKIVEKAMLDIRDLGLPWHYMTMQCSSNVEAAFLTDYTNVAKSHWTANLKPNCQKILAELVGMHLIGFNWMPELAPICHIKELTFAPLPPLPCKIALFCKNAPTMCIKCWSHFTFSCFSPLIVGHPSHYSQTSKALPSSSQDCGCGVNKTGNSVLFNGRLQSWQSPIINLPLL